MWSTTIASSEYTVTYSNNTNAWTANFTVTAKSTSTNFTGSKGGTFTIWKATGTGSVTMNGWTYGWTATNPVPTSSTNGTSSVTYKYKVSTAADSTYTTTKPSNAWTYTVQATFAATDNYNAVTATANFTIAKASITVPSSPTAKTYNTQSQSHGISVPTHTSIVTSSSTTSATDAWTYNVVLKLDDASNYQWSDWTTSNKTVTWKINQYNLSNATIGSVSAVTYNGSAHTPTPGVTVPIPSSSNATTLTSGTHFAYSYSNNTNAWTATITVTAKANTNYTGSKTKDFTINKASIAVPSSPSAKTYNGASQNHGISVPSNTSIVTASSTTSATNAWTYNVVFQLSDTSNYKWNDGTTTNKTVTWTINPYNLSNATATIAAQTYNGSALTPAPTVKMGSTTIASSEYTVTYSNNTNAWTANFTVTAKSTSTNYTGSTGGIFTIIDNTAPTCTITEAACTSGSLRLTLTWSENLITPNWWNKTNDTTYWNDVTSNNSVSVIVTDINWNTWTCSITPTNYDKTAPTTTASWVPSGWTGNNITVTLSAWSNGCNSTNTTYYCVYDSWSTACIPNTQWTSVNVTCDAWSTCQKFVRYYSKDGLGNTETTKSTSVIKIDKTNPVITVTDASTACAASKTVKANITDVDAWVSTRQYVKTSSSTCNANTTSSWTTYTNNVDITLNAESDNNQYICFKAVDAVWNTSYARSAQITNIDAAGPETPTLDSPIDNYTTNNRTPTLSWTSWSIAWCSTFSNYEIQVCSDNQCNTVEQSNTSATSTSWTLTTQLPAWDHYWRVREKDSLWRYSAWTNVRKITIDTTDLTCNITQSSCTSGNLTLTLTSNKEIISIPDGWTKVDNMTYRKTVTSNASVSATISDIAWYTTTCDITPTNYDKTAPTTTASAIPSWWTWSNVTVTLSTNNNGCNSTNTTYYCVDTANTCTPTTQWTGVSVECAVWSQCEKYVRYYSKDGLGNTETVKSTNVIKIDKKWPTFTFVNNSWAECTAWSLSITSASDNNGVWLASSAYNFGNGNWWTATSTGIAAQQPWSVTITWYVRDSLGNQTVQTATYTFNNVAPTADNFSVSSVWTWKTVNWKILSHATEWNCWSWGLSATRKPDAASSMWSCTVSWDYITFVATWWASWTATCVITIKDNENSTKDITITWNDVSRPIPQITFVDPTPAHNSAVTQNRFTAKMDISNIDEIQSFEYKYDNTPYDIMNWLVLMYNFDKVSSLWESNTLVKDLSHNWKDGSVNWATWASNGKYGWAYSFDWNDYIKFTGLSLTNYTIVLWEKTSAWSWRQIVYTNWTKYINWISASVNNERVDLTNWYIGRVGSSYYNWTIDEVRVYNRVLSQGEVQFLYKSNLKKTSQTTWEFETVNTCLDATWAYNYSWKVVSYVDTQAATGRKLTTNIPLVSVSWTWYDFWTHTASWSVQTLNGTMWTLTVTDKLWNSWWLVYLATSDTLVWKNTAQTIDTTNLKFKANSLVFNWLYDSSVNTHVAFGNWISTSQYKTAHSNCAAWAEHCASSSARILEYMRRSAEPYDFMCGDVWTYSDDTKIQLEVPAWQIQDTYEWTLWITLQDDYGFRQRWTWATIN